MKAVNVKYDIYEVIGEGQKLFQTDFLADSEQEVTDVNADVGGAYFQYPVGSSILCLENGKVYVLNETQTEFAEVGNYTPPTPEEPADEDENEGE